MPWPTVSPATWSQAVAADTFDAVRPITATSSISQSTVSVGKRRSPTGPVRLEANLVKIMGCAGTSMPVSSEWAA